MAERRGAEDEVGSRRGFTASGRRGVCAEVGTEAVLPLWHRDRRTVTDRLLAAGFEAVIVAVRDEVLPPSLLGRTLDADVLAEIEEAGADACGENGEFHTPSSSAAPSFEERSTSSSGRGACATMSGS